MADDDTDTPEGAIVTQRDLQLARFHALGGGKLLQEEIRDARPRLMYADVVTDGHRELVGKLAAAGLSNQAIADILGISKERTQELFAYELATGFELAMANLSNSLFINGVCGDTSAALGWLRNHNKSQWRTKHDVNQNNRNEEVTGAEKNTEKSREFLAKILGDMMTDKKLKGTAKQVAVSTVAPKIAAPVKTGKGSIRKPRQEEIDDE